MSASQTLDYEHPYSLVPGTSTTLARCAERCALGHTAWPGEGAFTAPGLRFGGSHSPLFEACSRARGCCPRRGRCDRPLTSVSPLPLAGFRRTCCHAFAWVLPGGSRQDSRCQRRVKGDGAHESRTPSIDRGRFAWAGLALRLGLGALRAASPSEEGPSCALVSPKRAWVKSEVASATHRPSPRDA